MDGARSTTSIASIRNFDRNPNELMFGGKPALPEYHGGP